MGNFYFIQSSGEQLLIAENCTQKEGEKSMYDFLKNHNFTSYYTRIWKTNDGATHYDVGSHTEFFTFEPNS